MSKLGGELVRSMAQAQAQALAHAEGKRTGAPVHRVDIGPENRNLVRALRNNEHGARAQRKDR
jgi:hypothetical protein